MSLRSDLDAILESAEPLGQIDGWIWQNLRSGASSKRHPWNAGAFSTVDVNEEGRVSPKSRTVILRKIDSGSRSIDFFTDVRTAKVHQLQLEGTETPPGAVDPTQRRNVSSEVCWLFYRHTTKIQVRLEGFATMLSLDEEEVAWKSTPLSSRSVYASIEPPGLVRPSTQPPDTSDREVTEMESERGRENFRVIRSIIRTADVLYLRDEGHIRARVEYDSGGQSLAKWLVP